MNIEGSYYFTSSWEFNWIQVTLLADSFFANNTSITVKCVCISVTSPLEFHSICFHSGRTPAKSTGYPSSSSLCISLAWRWDS